MAAPKFTMPDVPPVLLLAGAGVVVLLLAGSLYKPRDDSQEDGNTGGFWQDAGEDAGKVVVDLADGVISGAAKSIGDIIGVPRTDKTKCQLAMAQGRTWDAISDCSAGTFIKYWWDK
jgi:hypothetical protein